MAMTYFTGSYRATEPAPDDGDAETRRWLQGYAHRRAMAGMGSRSDYLNGLGGAVDEVQCNWLGAPEDVPWAVVGEGDLGTARYVVHYMGPVHPGAALALEDYGHRWLPMQLRLDVTERAPLCTEHPDCWEAGEEMRRSCYAGRR